MKPPMREAPMRTRSRRTLALRGALAAVMLSGAVAIGTAQPETDERRSRLAEIEKAVSELEERLARTRQQADDLVGRAGRARASADLQRQRLRLSRAQLEEVRSALDESSARIDVLQSQVSGLSGRLRRSTRALYRIGRLAYLRVLFSLRETDRALPAIRQLRYLTRRDASLLSAYRQSSERLQEERIRLQSRQAQLAELVRREELEATRLRREERRLQSLLDELRVRRRRIESEVADFRDRSQSLSRLVEILEGEGASGLSGQPIQGFRGGLDWPVEGDVTLDFGQRRDPKYGTRIPHNGIEVTPHSPGPVSAVFPGRVIFAAPFQDLGYTVVVQHEEGVLTLYAGLSELSAAEGDVLALGDPVGRVAERLYFELREQRQPEDPRRWLR